MLHALYFFFWISFVLLALGLVLDEFVRGGSAWQRVANISTPLGVLGMFAAFFGAILLRLVGSA